MPLKRSKFIGGCEFDIASTDEATNLENRPTRRMLTNAAIGMDPEDAYYAAHELREAVKWVHEGEQGEKRKLAMILVNSCDDYQRCLFYAVAGRGVVLMMMEDLLWLEQLLEARCRTAGVIHKAKIVRNPLASPYIGAEPDGPVGKILDDSHKGLPGGGIRHSMRTRCGDRSIKGEARDDQSQWR